MSNPSSDSAPDDQLIELLEARGNAYSVALRLGRGPDPILFDDLMAALAACAGRWATEPVVPRRLASYLVSLAVGVAADSGLYKADEGRLAVKQAGYIYMGCSKVVRWQPNPQHDEQ